MAGLLVILMGRRVLSLRRATWRGGGIFGELRGVQGLTVGRHQWDFDRQGAG